jgi:archaeal flagellin FlaB
MVVGKITRVRRYPINETKNRLIARLYHGQKGITGLETAIILIAFVVVAAVFAGSLLSSGLFTVDKAGQAVYSGLEAVQGALELRGGVIGCRDTLNTSAKGSLGKVELPVTLFAGGSPLDLTPSYTIDPGTGALINSNPGGNFCQISFLDRDVSIADCAWTAAWIGANNADYMLDADEQTVITVWLHTFNGTDWGPAVSESPPFLGDYYVDTYHAFTLAVKFAQRPVLSIARTTPAYLNQVVNLR